MLKPQGYVTIVGDFKLPDNKPIERDTITCGHCQQLVFVKPGTVSTVYLIPQVNGPDKEESGAGCFVCGRKVCLRCHADGRCRVWERQIEEMEQRGRFLHAVLGHS